MSIKNLGAIVTIHSSGMVETDKGNKYPYNKAKIGDMMVKVDHDIKVVTKEEFKKDYLPLLSKEEAKVNAKAAKEAEEAAKAAKEAEGKGGDE